MTTQRIIESTLVKVVEWCIILAVVMAGSTMKKKKKNLQKKIKSMKRREIKCRVVHHIAVHLYLPYL